MIGWPFGMLRVLLSLGLGDWEPGRVRIAGAAGARRGMCYQRQAGSKKEKKVVQGQRRQRHGDGDGGGPGGWWRPLKSKCNM